MCYLCPFNVFIIMNECIHLVNHLFLPWIGESAAAIPIDCLALVIHPNSQMFQLKIAPYSAASVCVCVCLKWSTRSMYISLHIQQTKIYDKHSENTVSLSDNSMIIIVMDKQAEGYVKWVTKLNLLLVVKWQREVLLEITPCNYVSWLKGLSFHRFLSVTP